MFAASHQFERSQLVGHMSPEQSGLSPMSHDRYLRDFAFTKTWTDDDILVRFLGSKVFDQIRLQSKFWE